MNSDGALTNAFMSTETDVCLPSTAPPAIPATSVITEQFNRSNPQFTVLLRNSILNEVLLQLPSLVEEYMAQNEGRFNETYISSPGSAPHKLAVENLEREINEQKKKNKDFDNKMKGFDTKLQKWSEAVSSLDYNVGVLSTQIDNFGKNITKMEKGISNKTKDYINAQKKIEKALQDLEKSRISLKQSIDSIQTVDGKKIIELEGSQEFVSSKYDDVVQSNAEIKQSIAELAVKVDRNAKKSEHNAGYSRLDSAEFAGVPVQPNFEGKENCKEIITNICKELHLSLPEDAISTAHRLKQHSSKTTPPAIIVKFKGRDDRNAVFALREQLKVTKINIYGINTLYINESLTPDKRKLIYECKKFARQNFNSYGKIYVWSFKGEVYVRQNMENAARYQINSTNDIEQFGKKCIVVNAEVVNGSAN